MIKVLIADDHVVVRGGLKQLFTLMGDVAVAGEAVDGMEVLELLKRGSRFDLLVLDLTMPGLSGVNLITRIRALNKSLPILVLSMHNELQVAKRVLQAGATGYLLKQSAHDELLAALRYVHAGGSPMTSYIARRVAQCFPNPPARTGSDDELSPREREVLEMLARGFLYKEIAEALNISIRTVDTYIRRIYEKLHVRSRAQAVAKYVTFPFADSRAAGPR